MAFSKKPSSAAAMFVVLMLLVTQLVDSKPIKPGPFCKTKCLKRCIRDIFRPSYFAPCMGACFYMCGALKKKVWSHPSFQCGVGCVRSKCTKPGDGNGKVSEECITSCVNDCDEKFVNDVY